MTIQLLTFEGCARAERARQVLREALRREGLPDAFEELDVTTEPALRGWGSPTILIDGRDVLGTQVPVAAVACRIVVPSVEQVRDALRRAAELG